MHHIHFAPKHCLPIALTRPIATAADAADAANSTASGDARWLDSSRQWLRAKTLLARRCVQPLMLLESRLLALPRAKAQVRRGGGRACRVEHSPEQLRGADPGCASRAAPLPSQAFRSSQMKLSVCRSSLCPAACSLTWSSSPPYRAKTF